MMKSEYIVQYTLKKEWNIVSCMVTVITQTYWTFHIFMCLLVSSTLLHFV